MEKDKQGGLRIGDAIAKSAASIFNSPAGAQVGMGLYFLLFLGGFALYEVATKWDGHLFSQKGCIVLQEINSKLYTVNSCTGDIKEIVPEKQAPSAATSEKATQYK